MANNYTKEEFYGKTELGIWLRMGEEHRRDFREGSSNYGTWNSRHTTTRP